MSWRELQDGQPDLAAFGERRFRSGVAYLATIGVDGSPRVHPVTPIVTPHRLFVFMEPTSPKGRDLLRGSHYALHCAVEDEEGGGGEFRVRGTARHVTAESSRAAAADAAPYDPADEYVLFELLVDDAFSTVYEGEAAPVRWTWTRRS